MDELSLLHRELLFAFEGWLGREPAERMRRLQAIAQVGERTPPVLFAMVAEDQCLMVDVHRMPARLLPRLEWQPAPGNLGIPLPDDGSR